MPLSSDSKKKILLTGATGFIGRHLLDTFETENVEIILLSSKSSSSNVIGSLKQFRYSFSPQFIPEHAFEGIDTVIHLAGIAHSNLTDHNYSLINAEFTNSLIELSVKNNVKKFIYVSSSLADSGTNYPENSYIGSKQRAESYLRSACLSERLTGAIIRPVNVYGTGMKGNIATLVRLISKGLIPRLPTLSNRLSLVSAKDVSRAIILFTNLEFDNCVTYTITDGEKYRVNDIESAIYQSCARKLPHWTCPRVILLFAALGASTLSKLGIWKNGISKKTYDNLVDNNLHSSSKISQDLGFQPSVTLFDELPKIVQYMNSTTEKETKQSND